MPLRPTLYAADDTLKIISRAADTAFGATIRVLCWNVYKSRRPDWRADFTALLPSHDLVLLQESVMNAGHDDIFEGSGGLEWVMARGYKMRRNDNITGIKTGSIVASTAQKFFKSPDSEPFLKTPKLLLATIYPLGPGDQTLLVLNIHAINFVSLKKYRRQLAQITEAVRDHAGPVILGGDFNTWSTGRLKHFHKTMADCGLREARLARTPRLRHFNRHLDYIFYRDLTLENATVRTDIGSSDHAPLSATFKV